jgi:hypothetical protein
MSQLLIMGSRKCTLKQRSVFRKHFHFPDFLFTLELLIPSSIRIPAMPQMAPSTAELLKNHFSNPCLCNTCIVSAFTRKMDPDGNRTNLRIDRGIDSHAVYIN